MTKTLWGALCAALLWGGPVVAQARAPDTNQEMQTGISAVRPDDLPADKGVDSATDQASQEQGDKSVAGAIRQVSKKRLLLEGEDQPLYLDRDSTILRDGQPAGVTELKKGDQVKATFEIKAGRRTATQIEAVDALHGPRAELGPVATGDAIGQTNDGAGDPTGIGAARPGAASGTGDEVGAQTKPDTTKGTTYGNQNGAYTRPGYKTQKDPADKHNGNLGGTQAVPGHKMKDRGELQGLNGEFEGSEATRNTPAYGDPSAPLQRTPRELNAQRNSNLHAYPNPASLNDERGTSPDNLNQNPGQDVGRDRSAAPPAQK